METEATAESETAPPPATEPRQAPPQGGYEQRPGWRASRFLQGLQVTSIGEINVRPRR